MYLLQGDYSEVKGYCKTLFDDDYFEFEFPYVAENEKFREIDRFLWESRHECTRYKNRYDGNFVIGLNEWNESKPNKYFDAFMYFLSDKLRFARSCILFVEDCIDEELMTALEKHFNIVEKELTLTEKKSRTQRQIGFCIATTEKEKENV